jgi:spermidine synthase
VDLFATYAGSATDLQPWLRDAQVNRDRNLRLQYLAGRGLNLYRAGDIFAEMLPFAQDPQSVFTGSDALMQSLMQKMHAAQGR